MTTNNKNQISVFPWFLSGMACFCSSNHSHPLEPCGYQDRALNLVLEVKQMVWVFGKLCMSYIQTVSFSWDLGIQIFLYCDQSSPQTLTQETGKGNNWLSQLYLKCFHFTTAQVSLLFIIQSFKKIYFYVHCCFACMCLCEGVRSPGSGVTVVETTWQNEKETRNTQQTHLEVY